MNRQARAALLIGLMLAGCGCGSDTDSDTAGTLGAVNTADVPSSPATPDGTAAASTRPAATDASGPTQPVFTVTPLSPRSALPPIPAGEAIDHDLAIVRDAVADLASRLGVDIAAIAVIDARAVTWGDASHGCPEPGVAYPPRLVDGAAVVLEVDGRRYDYRGGVPLRLCEPG